MEKIKFFITENYRLIINILGLVSLALATMLDLLIIQDVELIKWASLGIIIIGYITNYYKKDKK